MVCVDELTFFGAIRRTICAKESCFASRAASFSIHRERELDELRFVVDSHYLRYRDTYMVDDPNAVGVIAFKHRPKPFEQLPSSLQLILVQHLLKHCEWQRHGRRCHSTWLGLCCCYSWWTKVFLLWSLIFLQFLSFPSDESKQR